MACLALKDLAKKILRHRKDYYQNFFFRRTGAEKLAQFLRELGLKSGMVVFVHTSFSSLGYFAPGATGLINVLRDLVGPQGTIVMPSFPFNGAMEDFVATGPIFDIAQTPSAVGYITEVFRTYPGVLRSLHPTHPICALGRHARDLVKGHERTISPCGPNSPYGRLGDLDAWLLRIGTGALTLFHHVQELVNFPNLFLPELVTLSCVDHSRNRILVRTQVHRKRIPTTLYIGENTTNQTLTVHLRDFPILFSGEREQYLRRDPSRQRVLTELLKIRKWFVEKGQLKIGEINGCKCELFRVQAYLEYAVPEVKRLVNKFRFKYNLSRLQDQL